MNVRKQAVKTLLRVHQEGAYSNLEVKTVLAHPEIKAEDRGLYLNIVYGVLQKQIYLDYLLNRMVKKNIHQLDQVVLEILRTAYYQLFFLDRVPDYAVVNESVKLAGKMAPRARGFVNGVLRNTLRHKATLSFDPNAFADKKEALSVECSVPAWIIEQYIENFGWNDAVKILKRMDQQPPFTIRVNTLKITKEKLKQLLKNEEIEVLDGQLSPDALMLKKINRFSQGIEKHDFYQKGFFSIQDQGAMLTAELLNPRKGETILDMCAAPGGKTTHLSQLMKNTGRIIARDVFDSRIDLIKQTADRLGTTNICAEKADGMIFDSGQAEQFDRILLDAPCSGLGIIRRKPEIRYTMNQDMSQSLKAIQRRLLDNAVQYLKPGGVLVYSTCTVGKSENEAQIYDLLERFPNMVLDQQVGEKGMLHTSPLNDNCDAFFMARLKKKSC